MGFFTAKQKRLARNCSVRELENGYHDSESALLYKNTPEYNKRRK